MNNYAARPLIVALAIASSLGFARFAQAQLTCPGSTGSGDQTWGGSLGPNELADACGTTGVGFFSLYNDSGSLNSALGLNALFANTTGSGNTSVGADSTFSNTVGIDNSALGYMALYNNTTGSYNTAVGFSAFLANTTGNYTTAVGAGAMSANTTGTNNTAIGYNSLADNTTGSQNSSFGRGTLRLNTVGSGLTAAGYATLFSNTTGSGNTAFGYQALYSETTGSNNIAVGNGAGFNVLTGSNNIEIGTPGRPTDDATIQIGVEGVQTSAYIAGISNAQVTGAPVYVNSSGQLGVLASSERYKTDIAPIGVDSADLQRLRPVRFHLKSDPHGAVQYGLIAEEVDKIYPELVIRDAGGQIQGVRYDELAPMLLSEVQGQRAQLAAQTERLAAQSAQLARLQAQISGLVAKLQSGGDLLAQR
jgi:hypothetical protein